MEIVAYLTAAEAALRLKMTTHTVRRILCAGGLPGRKIGKQWRIPADELAQFMAAEDEIEEFMAEQRLLLLSLNDHFLDACAKYCTGVPPGLPKRM